MPGEIPTAVEPADEAGLSFRAYLLSRRYTYARSDSESWGFVTQAVGDEYLLSAGAWRDVRLRLVRLGEPAEALFAARKVWRSYARWRLQAPVRLRKP